MVSGLSAVFLGDAMGPSRRNGLGMRLTSEKEILVMQKDEAAPENSSLHERLLDAALVFAGSTGWSDRTFRKAAQSVNISEEEACAVFPAKGQGLVQAFFQRGDTTMETMLLAEDLTTLRFRDRVARAILLRLTIMDGQREAVRRATSLFALPLNAHLGARVTWQTADLIWNCLGDDSEDVNWYTKRMTLSAVYGASLLYWLDDLSPNCNASQEFIDRRIGDVMKIEGFKSRMRQNPAFSTLMRGIDNLGRQFRRPNHQGAAAASTRSRDDDERAE